MIRVSELAAASAAVTATPARNEKVALLAVLLARADSDEVGPVVSWLSGELTQRQIGVGWALLREPPPPAPEASLTVAELERALGAIGAMRGPGSVAARRAAVRALMARADAAEQEFLLRLLPAISARARSRASWPMPSRAPRDCPRHSCGAR